MQVGSHFPYSITPGRRSRSPKRRRDDALDLETIVWKNAIEAGGGLFMPDSVAIADRLITAIKRASYGAKIIYLIPFLGANVRAAIQPLRDSLANGVPGNNGPFLDADFTQAAGLQGNGSTKGLATTIKPSALGATNNGGLGCWELNVDNTGSTYAALGAANTAGTNYFTLRNYSTTYLDCIWGLSANAAASVTSGGNGHAYMQRSSATLREVVWNGAQVATNTTSDATSGASDLDIIIFGWRLGVGTAQYNKGRFGCAYMTDGTLSSADYADFHLLIRDRLMLPTRRI